MKVKNIKGTSKNTCSCISWIVHWKKHSGKTLPVDCAKSGCTAKATVGGHVQKDIASDNSWYIVPLCDSHNKAGDSFEVVVSTVFVSANVSNTCG